MIFASPEPVAERAVVELLLQRGLLADAARADETVRALIDAIRADWADRGVTLVPVASGWQFRTAPDLAPHLVQVMKRPRRLPPSAVETLAVIAYHQPCTRAEIETVRGVSLGQQTLDLLLEAGLVVSKGRKEVPGRPTLWGTSAGFLKRFGLNALGDLPRREDLLLELPSPNKDRAPADDG